MLEPIRKSSRIKNDSSGHASVTTPVTPVTPVVEQTKNPYENPNQNSTPRSHAAVTPVTREKKEKLRSLRKIWDEKIGSDLFDIKSQHKIQQCVSQGD